MGGVGPPTPQQLPTLDSMTKILCSVDVIVVTNQVIFNFMPSYGVGMVAGCTGIVTSLLGFRATKETIVAIFFRKYKLVSIFATFGAVMAMSGVLWLGIVFSMHVRLCLKFFFLKNYQDCLFGKS